MYNNEEKANAAYREIRKNAGSNQWLQGLSGVFGFPYTTIVDVGVLFTHYAPMFNNIRAIYNRSEVSIKTAGVLSKNIVHELLYDFVTDKLMGNIPIIGVYFNVICAKALSWRLGILFTMLSARGEEINQETVSDVVFVIRNVYKKELFQNKSAFSFIPPDRAEFIEMIVSSTDVSEAEFTDKIMQAKAILSK